MKILVSVDQRESLRRGIDAPSSTTSIDVVPVDLSPGEREYLASVLRDGHDASREIQVPTPDLPGLREAIAAALAAAAAAEEECKARQAAEDEAILALLAAPRDSEIITIGFTADGRAADYSGVVSAKISLPQLRSSLSTNRASAAVQDAYSAARIATEAEASRLRREAYDALRPEYEAWLAGNAASRAAIQAEYDALYARLPEALRKRDAAGFADTDEVAKALRRLIRADAGLSQPAGWDGSEKLTVLTDAEFVAFQAAEKVAPDGATIEPRLIWNGTRGYRKATDDEYDLADDDGEVWEEGENLRRVALITWKRCGITTTATIPLS